MREHPEWEDRLIVNKLGCGHPLVAGIRQELEPAGRAAGATAGGSRASNAARRQSIITRRSHTAPAESTYPRISLPPYGLDLLP